MDQDHTDPLGAICSGSEEQSDWVYTVCMPKLVLDISICMQQMTKADNIFICILLIARKGLNLISVL